MSGNEIVAAIVAGAIVGGIVLGVLANWWIER